MSLVISKYIVLFYFFSYISVEVKSCTHLTVSYMLFLFCRNFIDKF